MRGHPISIVYFKEWRDLLRDPRTIISMIVVPLLIMPVLLVTVGSLATKVVGKARQETPKVMLLGGGDSPETAAALRALKTFQFVPASADYTNLISDKKIGAAVEMSAGFDAALAAGRKAAYTFTLMRGYEIDHRGRGARSILPASPRRPDPAGAGGAPSAGNSLDALLHPADQCGVAEESHGQRRGDDFALPGGVDVPDGGDLSGD